MSDRRDADGCGPGHCVTCADEGVVMRVASAGADGLAVCVDPAGRTVEVQVDLVERVTAGEAVLVHAGVALAHLGEHP